MFHEFSLLAGYLIPAPPFSYPHRQHGRILFMVDGQVVGDPSGIAVTALSGSTARATFTVTGLKHGRHRVTATYLGESMCRGSTAAVTQTVT